MLWWDTFEVNMIIFVSVVVAVLTFTVTVIAIVIICYSLHGRKHTKANSHVGTSADCVTARNGVRTYPLAFSTHLSGRGSVERK